MIRQTNKKEVMAFSTLFLTKKWYERDQCDPNK